MWPDLGHVEDVPFVVLGLLRTHDLHKHVPFRILFLLDRFEEVVYEVVGVFACDFRSGLSIEVLDAELALDVHLDVAKRTILEQHALGEYGRDRLGTRTSLVNL